MYKLNHKWWNILQLKIQDSFYVKKRLYALYMVPNKSQIPISSLECIFIITVENPMF